MVEHPPRKLAVILHADVVGSTALVQRNETIAHGRIQDAFRRFSRTIENYGGMTHELRGDALVAEFNRASDAVSAALAFQATNAAFNATLDDHIQPQIRIGISLGEVVIADNTITGAGVVLAQRLEQLAESGGVCIQGAAYETVPQRLPFAYENLGEQEVKGFADPVRVYAVNLKRGETIPAPEPVEAARARGRKPMWPRPVAGVTVVLILIGVTLAWWQPRESRKGPTSIEPTTIPLPNEPTNRAKYGRSTVKAGRMNLKLVLPDRWDARLVTGGDAIYEGFEFGVATPPVVPKHLLAGDFGNLKDVQLAIARDKKGVAHFRVFKMYLHGMVEPGDKDRWMQDEGMKVLLGWYAGVYGYEETRGTTKTTRLRSGEEVTVIQSLLRINYRTRHVRVAYAERGASSRQHLVFFFYNVEDPREIGDELVGTVIGAATEMFN